MLSCKQASSLVSRAMDEPLSLRQRLALRLHLAMCRYCSRFARQLRLVRRVARSDDDADLLEPDARLSDEARARLRDAIQRQTGGTR